MHWYPREKSSGEVCKLIECSCITLFKMSETCWAEMVIRVYSFSGVRPFRNCLLALGFRHEASGVVFVALFQLVSFQSAEGFGVVAGP